MGWLDALWGRSVRCGFRLLYNEMAFTYDTVSKLVSQGQWRCWQRSVFEFLGEPTDDLILELAHGTGDLQLDLAKRGFSAIGYDLSPYMGRIARRKMMRHNISPRLVRGVAQQMPFVDAQWSTIVCTFPTSFIFLPQTLQELARILRDDGRLVIVLSGRFVKSGLIADGLEFLYRVTGQRREDMPDMEQKIITFFADAGFDARWEKVTCRQSESLMIFAQKRSSNPIKA